MKFRFLIWNVVILAEKAPHRRIGHDYMLRWFVIPRNRHCNIYLHQFQHDDDARGLHDHPWWSVSFLLWGKLAETYHDNTVYQPLQGFHPIIHRRIWPLIPYFRSAEHSHRIMLKSETAWTLFITGPVVRSWGFWMKDGWMNRNKFQDDEGREREPTNE